MVTYTSPKIDLMVPFRVLFVPNYRGPPLLAGKRDSAIWIDQFLLYSAKVKHFLDSLKVAWVHCNEEDDGVKNTILAESIYAFIYACISIVISVIDDLTFMMVYVCM